MKLHRILTSLAIGLTGLVTPVVAGLVVAPPAGATYATITAVSLTSPIVAIAPTRDSQGLWEATALGNVVTTGDAVGFGSMAGKPLNAPIVGMAATPTGGGYWLVASDGGIFAFGTATFKGSMGGHPLNEPVVGLAADPATGGYWEVASDGGIFAFTAPFYGSMGGSPLNQPVVGMTATPTGGGYWLVAKDGGIFAFGNAGFHGSTGATHLNAPIFAMASDPATGGYWFVASDGGIFAFTAPFYGSEGADPPASPVSAMAVEDGGDGYVICSQDGSCVAYPTPTLTPHETSKVTWAGSGAVTQVTGEYEYAASWGPHQTWPLIGGPEKAPSISGCNFAAPTSGVTDVDGVWYDNFTCTDAGWHALHEYSDTSTPLLSSATTISPCPNGMSSCTETDQIASVPFTFAVAFTVSATDNGTPAAGQRFTITTGFWTLGGTTDTSGSATVAGTYSSGHLTTTLGWGGTWGGGWSNPPGSMWLLPNPDPTGYADSTIIPVTELTFTAIE